MKPFGIKIPSQLNGVFSKITLRVAFCFAPKVRKRLDIPKGFIGNFLIKPFDILETIANPHGNREARARIFPGAPHGVSNPVTKSTLPRKIVKTASTGANPVGEKGMRMKSL